jgi:hypothetical protein
VALLLAFLIGFGVALLVVGVFVIREDLAELPRIWREEPDHNLRRWLVFLRRLVTGYSIQEPTWAWDRPNPPRVRVSRFTGEKK